MADDIEKKSESEKELIIEKNKKNTCVLDDALSGSESYLPLEDLLDFDEKIPDSKAIVPDSDAAEDNIGPDNDGDDEDDIVPDDKAESHVVKRGIDLKNSKKVEDLVSKFPYRSLTQIRNWLQDRGGSFSKRNYTQCYIQTLADCDNIYASMSPIERRYCTNSLEFSIYFANFVCFFIWSRMLIPTLKIVRIESIFISSAWAGGIQAAPEEIKNFVYVGIFSGLFLVFIISIFAAYFGRNPNNREFAVSTSKTLMGFFIGCASNFIT